ncbi:hypothetical protein [Altericista sp. CCNU0014]|uniref:hypothetical protein n=1 Tax=Altericista sp. CCNU0014 TaxID=3082949 RepID=UPI0038501EE5
MKNILRVSLIAIGGAIAVACQSTPFTTNNTSSPSPTLEAQKPDANFDETMYLFANPDVKQLIEQGRYKSGLDHYTQVGQTAKKPDGEDYESFFTGTNGSDTVQSFGKGKHAHLSGVAFEIVDQPKDPLPLRPKSFGKGEKDTLVGTQEGGNEFVLGSFITSVNPKAEPFYVGKGDDDYAQVQNFTPTNDVLLLTGIPNQYKFEAADSNLRILTTQGDLVAVIEGIDKLVVGDRFKELGVFTMMSPQFEKGKS